MDAKLRSGSPQDGKAEEQMDPILWSNISDDFLGQILACLPVACVLIMRAVCKNWKRIISSDLFLTAHAKLSSKKPFFLMFSHHVYRTVSSAAVYDFDLNKWHLIPLPNFLHGHEHGFLTVLASDGGLFCLKGEGLDRDSIFVSNPITRCQRKLPPVLSISMEHPFLHSLVVDRHGKGYKILRVAQQRDCLSSQIFDSKSNSWKITGVLNKTIYKLSGPVFLNGFLYCVSFQPYCVISFDLKLGIWHESNPVCPELDAPLPASFSCRYSFEKPSFSCRYLFEKQGELMMVIATEVFGDLKSVHFWRLTEGTKSWIEVNKVPEPYYQMFFKKSGEFICVSHGDQICFLIFESTNVLTYNFVEDEWSWLHWLPSYSIDEFFHIYSALGYAFEPRLDVEV